MLHGENTSIKKLGLQKKNHFKVVNDALRRQGVINYTYESINDLDDASRAYVFTPFTKPTKINDKDVLFIAITKEGINTLVFTYTLGDQWFVHKIANQDIDEQTNINIFRTAMLTIPFDCFQKIDIRGCVATNEMIAFFEKGLKVKIECFEHELPTNSIAVQSVKESDIILSFSGGFDSLAAHALLPTSKLLSIDFDGDYKRETEFFSKFPTKIVKWNIRTKRSKGLDKFPESKRWRFMLLPAVMSSLGSTAFIATGTILEASPFWANPSLRKKFSHYTHQGFGPGVVILNIVAGLSEYGTTSIVLKKFDSSIVSESLASLAAPESFKVHRKKCLIAAVNNCPEEVVNEPRIKYNFTSSFSEDMLTLYFCWKFGVPWVNKYYATGLPENLILHDFSFFEKLNINNMKLLDPTFRAKIIQRIKDFGIEVYTQEDMDNLSLVYQQLVNKKYH